MAIGPWVPVTGFRVKLADQGVRSSSAAWKIALFRSTSDLSEASTAYASVTGEAPSGNGYTTGGVSVTLTVTGTTTVTIALASVPGFAASGGSIVARYAALYEVGGDIAAFCLLDDTPADVTVGPGSTLDVNSPDVFTLA